MGEKFSNETISPKQTNKNFSVKSTAKESLLKILYAFDYYYNMHGQTQTFMLHKTSIEILNVSLVKIMKVVN